MPALPPFTAFAWIGAHPWLYPALEVVHIVGIALLLGSLVLVELRLWGLGAALPLPALARFGLSISLVGFALAAASGLTMFASQPGDLIANRMFVIKMGLLMLAGTNALAFHARGGVHKADALARAQTLLSLGLWLGIIICGRWIAYH
ncbi:hypothetical protein [Ideonella sp. A 288]|uniref:hypothetical protein n=1 Tax=Ideonella sp. A 288 TaxID=1962181 RepID=UPI000B4BEFD6|nr:hypothetical protein [Ideonella sp. A 288]